MSDFIAGRHYTRPQIHDKTGAPLQGMLPTVLNRVVACCVTWNKTEQEVSRLLIGDFPHQYPAAKQWVRGKQSVPLFIKRGPGKWEYLGDFHATDAGRSEDPSVVLVLQLEREPIVTPTD